MKLILLLVASFLCASNITAQTFVDANASGLNDGSSWVNAYSDLQSAIYTANAGDTIWVRQGTYQPSIDTLGVLPATPETRSFWLKNGVVVYGGFNGTETTLAQRDPVNLKATLDGVIDISQAAHVLHVYAGIDSTAILDGFIVQNGKTTVTSANQSGAGMLLVGDAHFYNIVFKDNEASQHGGAVYAAYSSSVFVSCRFEDNSTIQFDGGAANFVYSDIRMYNCVFASNHATRYGGAITTVESDLELQNGTFVANTGGNNIFQFSTSGSIAINNCIFTADNQAPTIMGSSGGAAIFRECLLPSLGTWSGLCSNCFHGTPSFTNAAAGDFSLVAGSTGINETLTVTPVNDYDDIAGNPRLVGTYMDLGAYENQGVLGIQTPGAAPHATIYPCPASSSLTIELTEPIESISIFNAAGAWIQSESQNTFSVENLPAGLYLVEIKTETGISRGRFFKE